MPQHPAKHQGIDEVTSSARAIHADATVMKARVHQHAVHRYGTKRRTKHRIRLVEIVEIDAIDGIYNRSPRAEKLPQVKPIMQLVINQHQS